MTLAIMAEPMEVTPERFVRMVEAKDHAHMMLVDWYYEADPLDSDDFSRQNLHAWMFDELKKLGLNPYEPELREAWRIWKAVNHG